MDKFRFFNSDPPISKRGTRKNNTEIVDTEVVTTTAPVGRPKKIGNALELDTIHKDHATKKQVKRLVNFKPRKWFLNWFYKWLLFDANLNFEYNFE